MISCVHRVNGAKPLSFRRDETKCVCPSRVYKIPALFATLGGTGGVRFLVLLTALLLILLSSLYVYNIIFLIFYIIFFGLD